MIGNIGVKLFQIWAIGLGDVINRRKPILKAESSPLIMSCSGQLKNCFKKNATFKHIRVKLTPFIVAKIALINTML